jgi:hypothetical protein
VAVPVEPEVRGTLAGAREPVSPSGKQDRDRSTVSARPFKLLTVTVEVVEAPPVARVRRSGLAEREKPGPGTVTVRKVALLVDPLIPVTATEYEPGSVLVVVSIVKVVVT